MYALQLEPWLKVRRPYVSDIGSERDKEDGDDSGRKLCITYCCQII